MFVTLYSAEQILKRESFQSLIGLCDVCDAAGPPKKAATPPRFQSLIGLCDVCDFRQYAPGKREAIGFNP